MDLKNILGTESNMKSVAYGIIQFFKMNSPHIEEIDVCRNIKAMIDVMVWILNVPKGPCAKDLVFSLLCYEEGEMGAFRRWGTVEGS
jgi:hypothetical protein